MKRPIMIPLALTLLLTGCGAEPAPNVQQDSDTDAPLQHAAVTEASEPSTSEHLLYTMDDVEWGPGPASLEPGAEAAVLEGDPSAPDVFTLRLKMPDGFHISPHSHPKVERVTVLSGAFHLGMGEALDRTSTERLPQGSYAALPVGMTHYAFAEGETIIQLTSVGPWEINYVNSEDDPRQR